jgi:hypothetical protein
MARNPDLNDLKAAIVAGLPPKARWLIRGTPLDFDFAMGHRHFVETTSVVSPEWHEPDWNELRIFASLNYSEGGGASPWHCIHKSNGAIYGLDLERDGKNVFPISSSLDRYIRTYTFLDTYLKLGRPLPTDVDKQVRGIDPKGYHGSDWQLLIEYLTSD